MLVIEEIIRLKEEGYWFITIDEEHFNFEEFGASSKQKDVKWRTRHYQLAVIAAVSSYKLEAHQFIKKSVGKYLVSTAMGVHRSSLVRQYSMHGCLLLSKLMVEVARTYLLSIGLIPDSFLLVPFFYLLILLGSCQFLEFLECLLQHLHTEKQK